MENTPTENKSKSFPWIPAVIVLIIILAIFQWAQTRPKTSTTDNFSSGYSTTTGDVIPSVTPITTPQATPSPVSTSTSTIKPNLKNNMHTITIETNKGTIVFETYDADAPKTSENFVTLANKGFYNGTIFHRVIPGFMIQGGDPTGTGMGGPGYKFADELDPNTPSSKAGYVRGTVAMANSGANTNGSQFFIMHKDTPLDHNYTIFGKVIKGMEVVDAIALVQRNDKDKPLETITMTKVTAVAK